MDIKRIYVGDRVTYRVSAARAETEQGQVVKRLTRSGRVIVRRARTRTLLAVPAEQVVRSVIR